MESQNMIHKQKLTKGGFKMKPTRFLIVAIVLMGLVATTSAAITEAGTVIENQAFGNYNDANGNAMTEVFSAVVQTTVSQVAGVTLGGNLANPVSAMDSTLYAVTLTNSGNGKDTYTIGATESATTGAFDFFVYHDADGSGTINGTEGDTEITLTDSVTFGGFYDLLIKVVDVTVGGADPGEQHVVTLTATTTFGTDSTASVTLTSTIQAATVAGTTEITGNPDPAPGEAITYESCFTNEGTSIAYNPVYTTVMPSNTTLDTTSVRIDGGSPVTVNTNGTGLYQYDIPSRTLTMNLDSLGFTTGVDDGVCISFNAVVDDPSAAGLPIDFPANNPELTYENAGGDPYPGTTPSEGTSFPPGGVEVDQTFGVSLVGVNAPYNYTGDPGDTLIYDFTVTNDGNGDDTFTLSDTSSFVTWVFYLDGDNDGVLSVTEKSVGGVITVTGTLTANQTVYYIAIGTIPVGTADGATDASILIAATSVGAATTTSSTGSASATCTAPILTLVKSVSPTGAQPPGTELTYTIIVANSGTGVATTVAVSDAIPANTTYVAESMTVDAAGDDDDNVVDGIETVDNASKEASSVLFDFDTIPAVTAGDDTDMHTLTFKVTID